MALATSQTANATSLQCGVRDPVTIAQAVRICCTVMHFLKHITSKHATCISQPHSILGFGPLDIERLYNLDILGMSLLATRLCGKQEKYSTQADTISYIIHRDEAFTCSGLASDEGSLTFYRTKINLRLLYQRWFRKGCEIASGPGLNSTSFVLCYVKRRS